MRAANCNRGVRNAGDPASSGMNAVASVCFAAAARGENPLRATPYAAFPAQTQKSGQFMCYRTGQI